MLSFLPKGIGAREKTTVLLCVNNDGSDNHILIVVGKSSKPLNTLKKLPA
jgi:hypothetical protein